MAPWPQWFINTRFDGFGILQSNVKNLTIENCPIGRILILQKTNFENLILKNVKILPDTKYTEKDVTYDNNVDLYINYKTTLITYTNKMIDLINKNNMPPKKKSLSAIQELILLIWILFFVILIFVSAFGFIAPLLGNIGGEPAGIMILMIIIGAGIILLPLSIAGLRAIVRIYRGKKARILLASFISVLLISTTVGILFGGDINETNERLQVIGIFLIIIPIFTVISTLVLWPVMFRSIIRPGIFLCHSSYDKEFAHQLANDLSSYDIHVWLKKAEMLIGDSLFEKIQKNISHTDCIGAIISYFSVRSDWVRYDLNILMKQDPRKYKKIIPILIDDCKIPELFKDNISVDFRDKKRYGESFAKILSQLGESQDSTEPELRI